MVDRAGALVIALRGERLATYVRGAQEVIVDDLGVTPLRLPRWTDARGADDGIRAIAATTAGVRIQAFSAARTVELRLDVRAFDYGDSGASWPTALVVTADGVETDRASHIAGTDRLLSLRTRGLDDLTDHVRMIEIWLPHTAGVTVREARFDGEIFGEQTMLPRPRWTHHGSSISHGLEAHTARSTWPQQVARQIGAELTDLSLAGQCQLDPFVARTIADTPSDLISIKVGINLVNNGSMTPRTFGPALHGFLDIVTSAHPSTPIAIISPVLCPVHEDQPGPSTWDDHAAISGRAPYPGEDALTLRRIRALMRTVVSVRGDPHLFSIDGLTLLGAEPSDGERLTDGLHPDQKGHDLIAQRFVGESRPWHSGQL